MWAMLPGPYNHFRLTIPFSLPLTFTFLDCLSKTLFFLLVGSVSRRLSCLTTVECRNGLTVIQDGAKLLNTNMEKVRKSYELTFTQTDQLNHPILKFFPHIDA